MHSLQCHCPAWVGTFSLFLIAFAVGFLCMHPDLQWTLAAAEEPKALTLAESLEIAKQHNLSIQTAEQDLRAAEAQVRAARASLLPKIVGSGNYTYFKDVQKSVIQADGGFGFPVPDENMNGTSQPNADNEAELIELEFGAHHNAQGTINLTQPLFAWGRYYYSYQAAKIGYEATKKSVDIAHEQLRLDVSEAFYRVLVAQEFVRVAEQSVDLVKNHLAIAQASFEAGAATHFDVLRAKVQLSIAESQLIRAKNGVQTSTNAYKTLLNMPLATEIAVNGTFETPDMEMKLAGLIARAFEARPEISSAKLNEQVGQKQLAVAKTRNRPDLTFFSNYQISANERLTEPNRIWSLGLQINIPLFDGLATRAAVQQSESALKQRQLGTEKIRAAVELEVRNAYLNLLEAKTLIAAQRETVAQARESVRIATLQFENGMITTVALTDTQLALTQAEVNRLQAQHDYVVGLARLEKAVGQKLQ